MVINHPRNRIRPNAGGRCGEIRKTLEATTMGIPCPAPIPDFYHEDSGMLITAACAEIAEDSSFNTFGPVS